LNLSQVRRGAQVEGEDGHVAAAAHLRQLVGAAGGQTRRRQPNSPGRSGDVTSRLSSSASFMDRRESRVAASPPRRLGL
jgi:hypothetical protein